MSTTAQWTVVITPEGKNDDGRNDGSMIVWLRPRYGDKQEFSRVAFVRRNSTHPYATFTDQMRVETTRAKQAVAVLNTSVAGVLA